MLSFRLALLGLPRKTSIECLEVDESVPLLSHSPDRTRIPTVSSLLQTTRVSGKFPGTGKNLKKRSRPMIVVPNYRSAGSSGRMFAQMSQQPNLATYNNFRRSLDSNLSLSEDNADELSLRSILAQEDMRGEAAGNRFSRGLKNLRYLPQNMLSRRVNQFKARFSDSLDEESDLDSSFSSTWSLSTESIRSSISDLYPLGRNKKSHGHKRNSSDGIAAMLIRSVHAGLALDSVKEDHETPVPSPIRFISEESEGGDKSGEGPARREDEEIECGASGSAGKILTENSSTESDTESSEDEPSESSTNYNILDDSFAAGEEASSVQVDEDCEPKTESQSEPVPRSGRKLIREKNVDEANFFIYDPIPPSVIDQRKKSVSVSTSSSAESRGSDIWFDKQNSIEEVELIPRRANDEKNGDNDSVGSIPPEIIDAMDYAEITIDDTIPITSSMTAKETEFLDRQERFDSPDDSKPAAASTPTEDQSCDRIFFPDVDPWTEPKPVNLQRSVSLNEKTVRRFVAPGRSGLKKKSESFKTGTKRRLSIFRSLNISQGARGKDAHMESNVPDQVPVPEEPLVAPKVVEEERRKKVQRNETVIYRGASKDGEKTPSAFFEGKLTPQTASKPKPKPKPVSIVIASAPAPEDDRCHLSVPVFKITEVNAKSNFTDDETADKNHQLAEHATKFQCNYKRQCMMDLIKIIDTKMLVHSAMDHARKHKKEKMLPSLSPSPDSVRRPKSHAKKSKSRSRSPEESSLQGYATGSSLVRQNCSSASSVSRHAPPSPYHVPDNINRCEKSVSKVFTGSGSLEALDKSPSENRRRSSEADEIRETAVKLLAGATTPGDRPDVNVAVAVELKALDQFGLELEPNRTNDDDATGRGNLLTPSKLEIVSVVRKSHSECNLREAQQERDGAVEIINNTNTANITDNSCVPCYPDPHRQQQPEVVTDATPSPATPTPANLANKISKSPVPKPNSAVPIHRRSSDSDLSITPKGR